jgi:hypothetical protein
VSGRGGSRTIGRRVSEGVASSGSRAC